jgi:hypothetical protein
MMNGAPFDNLSPHDEYLEFYDDAGVFIRAQRKGACYDIYVQRDDRLVLDGKAYVRSNDCERVYHAYLDQKNIEGFFATKH